MPVGQSLPHPVLRMGTFSAQPRPMPVNAPSQVATPQAALDCAARALSPLVTMLIDCGVSAAEASHLMRWLFVQEAASRPTSGSRRESVSRIAAVTGIPRNEVKTLLQRKHELGAPRRDGSSQKTSRVLTGWLTDADYLAAEGTPRPLAYSGPSPSFSSLAKRYAGDTPPRAVLSELLESGAVQQISDDVFELSKRENYRISPDLNHLVDVGEALRAASHAITTDLSRSGGADPNYVLISAERIEEAKVFKMQRELKRRANSFALAANQYLIDQSTAAHDGDASAIPGAKVSVLISIAIEPAPGVAPEFSDARLSLNLPRKTS